MVRASSVILFLLSATSVVAQKTNELRGKVTFVTSTKVYVRFSSTEAILPGDTLFTSIGEQIIPALVVEKKSSISTVNEIIDASTPYETGQTITFRTTRQAGRPNLISDKSPNLTGPVRSAERERINGNISAATYMSHSSIGGSNTRNMYRVSFSAQNIQNSKLSAETYLTYRQNSSASERGIFQEKGLLNVYSLAVGYQIDSTLSISLGRKINRKVASLGPIDGVQGEKQLGDLHIGLLAGFRPDIRDHSFNSDLFQYGSYLGWNSSKNHLHATTTLGFLQQHNGSAIDRRYLYFQHTSTFFDDLSLFSSMELDLYSQGDSIQTNNTRLANFYVMARYRFSPKFNLTLSYDSRRRIIYYETFRTDIDQLLADDLARQGVRLRFSYRPVRLVTTGLTLSRRFQSDGQNQSYNINGFVSRSRLPLIDGRASLNFNYNRSRYLTNRIVALRYAREIIPGKLSGGIYGRNVHYQYLQRDQTIQQQYYGTNLTFRITKTLFFHALGEFARRTKESNRRINARIIKRF